MIWRIKAGKVDESLDVFACHGVGGAWGALATGIFATVAVNSGGADGLLYGGGMQVFRQLAAVGATCVYVFAVSWVLA
jgi:Amt family ammonium transporter